MINKTYLGIFGDLVEKKAYESKEARYQTLDSSQLKDKVKMYNRLLKHMPADNFQIKKYGTIEKSYPVVYYGHIRGYTVTSTMAPIKKWGQLYIIQKRNLAMGILEKRGDMDILSQQQIRSYEMLSCEKLKAKIEKYNGLLSKMPSEHTRYTKPNNEKVWSKTHIITKRDLASAVLKAKEEQEEFRNQKKGKYQSLSSNDLKRKIYRWNLELKNNYNNPKIRAKIAFASNILESRYWNQYRR